MIGELQKKVDTGEEITKADLLPLVLSPLMGGTMSQKERVSAAYYITGKAVKVEIKMTRLGKMLYDDGKGEGEKIGQSKVMILIQKMSADGALEEIPRLTTDSKYKIQNTNCELKN